MYQKPIAMKQLIILIGLFVSLACVGQETRALKEVTFSSSGYELGIQHGTQLKKEIGEVVSAWKKNTSTQLGKDADEVLTDFFNYADFDDAIKKWTPELFEEI